MSTKLYVLTAFLACASITANAQQPELKSTVIEKSENGHSFVLKLAKKQFKGENHDLSRIRDNIVDGKEIFGVDGSVPREEFSTFSLFIDGTVVPIPANIFSHFYDPNFGYERSSKYVDAFWGNDYECVFVYMNGSDGAGGYSVTWVLRKNGEHSYSLIPIYDMYFDFND
jgi:hypothetical protein